MSVFAGTLVGTALGDALGLPCEGLPASGSRQKKMANLGKKGEIYVARFRFEGKEYKKSSSKATLWRLELRNGRCKGFKRSLSVVSRVA